jgi:hypothetical protein
VQLEIRRDAVHELDERVVEERRPHLERARHAGAVRLHQDVVLEVEAAVEIDHALERIAARAFGFGGRDVLVDVDAAAVHEQPSLFPRPERPEPHLVAHARRMRCAEQEALELEIEAEVVGRYRQALGERHDDAVVQRPWQPVQARQALGLKGRVAGQDLVAAVTAQRHRHVPAREARQQIRRHDRRIGERFVEETGDLGEDVDHGARPQNFLVVLGAEEFGDTARMRRLVEGPVLEADRERLDAVRRHVIGHHRDHRAGVDAAGQEDAERHIAHEPQPHGFGQPAAQLFGILGLAAARTRGCEAHVPVTLHRAPAAFPQERVRRRQLVDAGEDTVRGRHVLVAQILGETACIDVARAGRMLQERLELGTKEQLTPGVGPVERLLAHAVARQEECLALRVPDREREHAVQFRDAVRTVLFPEMHDGFGIGAGPEGVAAALEVGPQILEVVDLAIEDDPHGAVFVRHRLVAAGEVDDRQAPEAEAEAGAAAAVLDVHAGIIGSPVLQDVRHAAENFAVDRAFEAENAGDATHGAYDVRDPPSAGRSASRSPPAPHSRSSRLRVSPIQ